jgi:replicative DNA helicase
VDWDKYGASSSIIILDYDVIMQKFKVIKRVEVPRGEYSYDNAINKIVELNDIYNPSFIFCDAGSGEYQIERLHIIGDQNPHTGLKNKVRRWQFAQTIDVVDPITFETAKEPLKPFMVNQLTLAFERSNIILSPFDDVLHKQLVNYEVEKINANGKPVYTSIDEHFIDALGLAYLAFVLEFKELTNVMKDPETSSKIVHTNKSIVKSGMNKMMQSIQSSYNNSSRVQLKPSDDRPGDKQKWVKVTQSYNPYRSSNSWGSRAGRGGGRLGRSMW